ncbi:hypothetical protein ACHAWF_016666 [Thalassiosira exigua]
MKSIEQSLLLKDGRTLAYHTFEEKDDVLLQQRHQRPKHPVLYFHGFPGCGAEAGIFCARSVAKEGGAVYAIDRPGMGTMSSRYDIDTRRNSNGVCDPARANLETFVDGVWELVKHEGWEEFSVIGVSGGGPYAMAFLASYLQKTIQEPRHQLSEHRLRSVCLVGAICMTAGTHGMLIEQLVKWANKGTSSFLHRCLLGMWAASLGLIFNYFIRWLPLSWLVYLNSWSNKLLPVADRTWMERPTNISSFLEATQTMVAQGGYPGVYDDAKILLRQEKRNPNEEIVRRCYGSASRSNNVDMMGSLPTVGIFHGTEDANVPVSHSKYMHDFVFHQRSTFIEYQGLGHVSTIAERSDEYAAFVNSDVPK